ncbi:hypothetical protein [Candidatus Nitrospira neomarina]|uniref:Uncharacterized protein n=1 Tax=Candidatus Nitrospira neomarina TaxID=3020899 RepID=A0AA96GGE4_9BACT|nr:hypothetical protein [Candidatus Nitrospira neomarina]WNM61311.1 hypothetical protein PQG83_16360 [Candidatus Nitrospira neomarina]
MSNVRRQPIKTNTLKPEADHRPGSPAHRMWPTLIRVGLLCGSVLLASTHVWATEPASINEEALLSTVWEYAHAVGKGDQVAAGQRDFVCIYQMAQQQLFSNGKFPDPSNPIYEWCDQRRQEAHQRAIQQNDRALDNVWPGPGKLVDFSDFERFFIAETLNQQLAPSFFVMQAIAVQEPTTPFIIEAVESGTLPHASFPSSDESRVVAAPTAFLTTKVSYPNALTAPIANAPGAEDWAVPYKKAQRVVKSVNVKWVVLSDLKQFGFPTDRAVLDLVLDGPRGTTIPFVVDPGGYVPHSTEWFGLPESLAAIETGIQQAQAAPTRLESVMRLNRVLLIGPSHKPALEVFSDQLYQGFLDYGGRLNGLQLGDERLAQRFNELYWTVQSQTDRFDLSLGMEIGGKSEPMPADYLYRMIPVMEALASLEPGDFNNRIRLSSTYRWTNDQMAALSAPQELLTEVPAEQEELRAQVLLELAWARIGKVAWNRHFDDPDIQRGFEAAQKAFELTNDPLNKFTAAYAMAYSLAFHVPRDNQAMLDLLQQARDWFEKTPGSSPQSWAYMLHNDTLKGLVENDPAFKSLLAAQLEPRK